MRMFVLFFDSCLYLVAYVMYKLMWHCCCLVYPVVCFFSSMYISVCVLCWQGS